jgi:hypothetical protein
MTEQDWGESPPLEAFDPTPNQEPHEHIADFLEQMSEDEDGYYKQILIMAAQELRRMGHELHGSR